MIFINETKKLSKMITGCKFNTKKNGEKSVYFGKFLGDKFGMVFQNTENAFWIKKVIDDANWDGKNFSLDVDYFLKALKASKKFIQIDVENNLIIVDGLFSVDAGLTNCHEKKLFPEIEVIHVSDINRKQFISNLNHVLPLVSVDKDKFILQHIGFGENGTVLYGTDGRRCARIFNEIIRVHNAAEKNGAIHSVPLKFAEYLFGGYELTYSKSQDNCFTRLIDEFGNIILSDNQYIYPEVHKAFENNNVVNPARFIVNVKELLSVLSSAKQILPENNKINVSFRPDGEIIISIKNGEVVTELNAYYRMIFNENWENKYHVNVDCLYLIDILKTVSSDFVSLCVEKVVDGGLHVAPLYFMEDNLNAEKFLMPLRS